MINDLDTFELILGADPLQIFLEVRSNLAIISGLNFVLELKKLKNHTSYPLPIFYTNPENFGDECIMLLSRPSTFINFTF
jgi:hypothetical protein